ncbi:MAG: hypothetical protein K6F46_00720 [Desulfovibrio sp.]|nr:hypothetical protein [Desulfovibrio sp.]
MKNDHNDTQTSDPTGITESFFDDALPRDGKYVLCKDEVYMVSSSGTFQLLPEVAPSIGYKLITTTLSSSMICKNGNFTDEASAMRILLKPMRAKAKNDHARPSGDSLSRSDTAPHDPGTSLGSALQKIRRTTENSSVKTANPQRVQVRWEKV